MAKSQHTTAVEVKITPENQAAISLLILRRRLEQTKAAIKFCKRQAAEQKAARA